MQMLLIRSDSVSDRLQKRHFIRKRQMQKHAWLHSDDSEAEPAKARRNGCLVPKQLKQTIMRIRKTVLAAQL